MQFDSFWKIEDLGESSGRPKSRLRRSHSCWVNRLELNFKNNFQEQDQNLSTAHLNIDVTYP